mmetsp:Transcript_43529/g.137721  ORF Transcript_43529/g.137721 Transcript_43529/m.137721 type:complete len:186 (+) Transcript_43529:149-706(+)
MLRLASKSQKTSPTSSGMKLTWTNRLSRIGGGSRACGVENFCLSALDLSYPECRKTLLDIDLFTTVLLLLLNLSILSRPSSSFLFFSCFFPPPLLSSLPSSRISPRPLSSPFLLTLSSLFYSHPPPGAWYVPVDSWKDMVTDARRRQTRSRNGSMPQMTGKEEEKLMSLMEKAQDEIVKLPGSKM